MDIYVRFKFWLKGALASLHLGELSTDCKHGGGIETHITNRPCRWRRQPCHTLLFESHCHSERLFGIHRPKGVLHPRSSSSLMRHQQHQQQSSHHVTRQRSNTDISLAAEAERGGKKEVHKAAIPLVSSSGDTR